MKSLKLKQNKTVRAKEKKKTYSLNILKEQVSHYKGFSYWMASAPVWISKYQMLLKAV